MSRTRVLAALVVLALIAAAVGGYLFINRSAPASAGAAATLTVFTGTAQVERAGATTFTAAHTGDKLGSGDTVLTGTATKASITFGDGSQTRLDESTQLQVKAIARTNGGFQTELLQTAGKTWSNVKSLAGTNSFRVQGPNNSTAEVRGTEFSVIVTKDAAGKPVVRINTFSGTVVVQTPAGNVTVTSGLSTTVSTNQAPTPVVTIPAGDKTDSWTVFNQAQTANTGTVTANVNSGTLNQGASTPVTTGATGDGNTDLSFTLSWPGSTFSLTIIDPDGHEYQTTTSATPPVSIAVPKARPGAWAFRVTDIQSSPGEVWAVVVGQTNPSTGTPTPFFLGGSACAHTVTAGVTDTWTVTARSAAGSPVLSVGTLPSYGRFQDNHDGTGTFSFAPPADLAAGDSLALTVSAAVTGATATLSCTERVTGNGRNSTISGTVAAAGAGINAVGVTLALPDGTTQTVSTAGGGRYSFGGLAAGVYTITISAPTGYTATAGTSRSVTVDGSAPATADFALLASPSPTPPPTAGPTPGPTAAPSPSPTPTVTPTPRARRPGRRPSRSSTRWTRGWRSWSARLRPRSSPGMRHARQRPARAWWRSASSCSPTRPRRPAR